MVKQIENKTKISLIVIIYSVSYVMCKMYLRVRCKYEREKKILMQLTSMDISVLEQPFNGAHSKKEIMNDK